MILKQFLCEHMWILQIDLVCSSKYKTGFFPFVIFAHFNSAHYSDPVVVVVAVVVVVDLSGLPVTSAFIDLLFVHSAQFFEVSSRMLLSGVRSSKQRQTKQEQFGGLYVASAPFSSYNKQVNPQAR
jgi:hypothetical protein